MADRSNKENEWFRKQEKQMLEHTREERERHLKTLQEKLDAEELERLREAHLLKCPKCGHDMQTTKLEGIEIEQCTFCNGVYFDRGELEKLLLREQPRRFKFFRRFFELD
jgi:hypothetical protein